MLSFVNQSFQAGTILSHAAHDVGREFVNTRDRNGMHEYIRHITDFKFLENYFFNQSSKLIVHPNRDDRREQGGPEE